MSSDGASEYFLDRKRASMVMSLSASEPAIRNIHLALADRYAELADDSADRPDTEPGSLEIEPRVFRRRSGRLTMAKSKVATSGDGARPRTEPLDITAVAGNVTIAATAEEVTSLTPQAAASTADRLLARGHEAATQQPEAAASRLPSRNADWSSDVSTQDGYAFRIRQASNSDQVATTAFSEDFDPEGMQASTLKGLQYAGSRHQDRHDDDAGPTKHYLAIESDTDRIIATAVAIKDRARPTIWAILIIRPDFKDGGIRWRLLEHIAALAIAGGISTLVAIEELSDQDLDTDHQSGWIASRYTPDPRFIVLSKTLHIL
jgi:hypothetical protein